MSGPWPLMPLGKVLTPVSRPVPVESDTEYRLLGARWYAKGLYVKEVKLGSEIRASTLYRVEEGDFVYNRLFAWMGSFALAGKESHGCYVSNEFPCFSVDLSRVEPKFLGLYFTQQSAWTAALARSSGGTPTSRNRLKEDRFLAMPFPLPSLAEQRRIVARVEAVAGRIGEAKRLREEAACVLAALSGSIVESLIPKSAELVPLKALVRPGSKLSYGVLVPGPDTENGVPFVRVQDLAIRNPPTVPSKRIAVAIDSAYQRTRLSGGEVLIGVVGSIGKIGVAPSCWAGANIARAVCRLDPDEKVDRFYLASVLESSPVQNFFRDATRTLAQPTLNVSLLEQTPIPLPPLAEQQRIVRRLTKYENKLTDLSSHQAETTVALDALLPAILSRAFAGQL